MNRISREDESREEARDPDVKYEFYPEGDFFAAGIVEFSAQGERKIIKESPKDVHGRYALHALYHIDTSREIGTVAWY